MVTKQVVPPARTVAKPPTFVRRPLPKLDLSEYDKVEMKRQIMCKVADSIVSYLFPNKGPKNSGKFAETGTRTGNAL